MDYHGRIMNIAIDPVRGGQIELAHPFTAYSIGHREARHAAAEIANEADAEIARLRDALESVCAANAGPRDNDSAEEWRAYWRELAVTRCAIARAALAQVAEVPE